MNVYQMKKTAPILHNRLMFFFGPPARFAAGLMVIAGIVALFVGGVTGIILVLGGLVMITTHSGVEIYDGNEYRLYYSILWLFRWGRRQDFRDYAWLSVRPWKGSHTVYSRSNRRIDLPDRKYVLYALSSHKHEKVPLYMANDKETVRRKGEEIRGLTWLEWKR